jgi:hypothetical protein
MTLPPPSFLRLWSGAVWPSQLAPLLLYGALHFILPLLTSTTLSISRSLVVFKLKLQNLGFSIGISKL